MFKGLLSGIAGIGDEFAKLKGAKANKDVLEAMVAGCVIVGASDGSFTDKEKDETIDSIMVSNFVEATGVSAAEVTTVLNKFATFRPTSASGRDRLITEIKQAGARPEVAQYQRPIFFAWLDVASAEGGIDAKERQALLDCGAALGLTNAASLIPAE